MGNNAYLNNGAFVAPHRGMCGHFAGLGTSGDILLEDTTFRGKPRSGITVASWVNLARTSRGIHSLFSTARVMTIGQVMGKDGFIFRWNKYKYLVQSTARLFLYFRTHPDLHTIGVHLFCLAETPVRFTRLVTHLRTVPPNTKLFLHTLWLCGKSRSYISKSYLNPKRKGGR